MTFARPSVLDVRLHERHVGTITNIADDVNVLSLDPAYTSDPDAPVLSFKAFRDATGAYRDRFRPTRTRLHPYFANMLPEGRLRAYLAQRAHVKPVRDFPLIWSLGTDLPGALTVVDPQARDAPRDDTAPDNDDEGSRSAGDTLRFSLAGVQLKFSLGGDPKRGLTLPVHGSGGHWILKLPDQRFKRVPENEFSMMTFAREVGIEVPQIGLVDPAAVRGMPSDVQNVSGKAYYIERFDRTPSGARIHTEDFAQANGIYPERKYSQFNFDLLAEQVAQQTGRDGMLDFVRRLVFTAGIGNGDMHAKNWSLIYRDGRTPTLAPAYDYLSTVVYLPNDDLGLNLLGSKRFEDVDERRIGGVADRALVPRKPLIAAAYEMADRMRQRWPRLAADLPLDSGDRALIAKHMDRIPLFRARRAF